MNGFILLTLSAFIVPGSSGAETVSVFIMEGDSVTLNSAVEMNQQDRIKWYFNGIRVAQITGDQSKVCTDDQCDGRFRDRLKLDHQTGSLTITNTRTTDSGEYTLDITSRNSERIFDVTVRSVSAAELKRNEGESVTLDSGGVKNTNYSMKWYFNDTLIAEVTGDQSQICTDDQCKERFRDRLKLDHQTGSLTITDTTNTDSGEYKLQINSSRFSIIRSFSVSVTDEVSVMEGDSVTLNSDVEINQQDRMKWYFNNSRIAEITGDLSKTCTDVQCKDGDERFRDRLKLDHQTGSLTITNITNTDSGEYKLQINSRNTERIFNVAVTAVPGSYVPPGAPEERSAAPLSVAAAVGIGVGVLFLVLAAAVACVIYYRHSE